LTIPHEGQGQRSESRDQGLGVRGAETAMLVGVGMHGF
jgi:hypothetical protein